MESLKRIDAERHGSYDCIFMVTKGPILWPGHRGQYTQRIVSSASLDSESGRYEKSGMWSKSRQTKMSVQGSAQIR